MADANTLRSDYNNILDCLPALQNLLKEGGNKSVQVPQAERGLAHCLNTNLFLDIANAAQRFMASNSATSNDVQRVQQSVQECAAHISDCTCIAKDACQSGSWTEQTESNYYESWKQFAYKLHSITLSVPMVHVDVDSVLGKSIVTVRSTLDLDSTFADSD
jgi:hypothetical protein